MLASVWRSVALLFVVVVSFIVLVLDSRGTALRSKAFQDESYGWVPSSANTEDHVIAIKQLCSRLFRDWFVVDFFFILFG